jgi:putative membrane protein
MGAGEILILLAAIGIDLLCRLAPAETPAFLPFIFNAPVFLGTLLALLWAWRGVRRLAPDSRPAWWRRLCFTAGVVLIHAVLLTRFDYYAEHMFFLNRLQQVAISGLAPFLIAIGWMGEALAAGMPHGARATLRSRPARALLRGLAHPFIAAVIFIAVTDLWLIPIVDFAAMIDPALYQVMNISMVLSGLLFWHVVLDPRPKPPARYSFLARGAAGFITMFPQIAVAATIALDPHDIYWFYALCGRILPGVGAAEDQLTGGIIQWIPMGMMNTAVVILCFNAIRIHEAKADKDFVIPEGARVYEAKWTGRQ